jgi:signal-transduction protein with cAMP-binding, CBS, and nucleotidyltransferase domain
MKTSIGFYRFLSEIAANYKPLLTRFGKFVLKAEGAHQGLFDIKDALMPFIFIARLFAYRYSMPAVSTLERFHRLALKNIIDPEDYLQIAKGYGFLMRLRIVSQVRNIFDENGEPKNFMDLRKLNREEQDTLKKSMKRVKTLQRYLGSVKTDQVSHSAPQKVTFD